MQCKVDIDIIQELTWTFLSISASSSKSLTTSPRDSLNFSWASLSTLTSSMLLQWTGSVMSSSAFSNHELKAEAFLANMRQRFSAWW